MARISGRSLRAVLNRATSLYRQNEWNARFLAWPSSHTDKILSASSKPIKSAPVLSVRYQSNLTLTTKIPSSDGVLDAAARVLLQQKEFIETISDENYRSKDPLIGSSVGGHVRHALDHYLKAITVQETDELVSTISYDHRERNNDIENKRSSAINEINKVLLMLERTDKSTLDKPVKVRFMMSAEGEEGEFYSTKGREIQFAMHHAIHHNFLLRVIAKTSNFQVEDEKIRQLGIAPSTSNYELKGQQSAASQ